MSLNLSRALSFCAAIGFSQAAQAAGTLNLNTYQSLQVTSPGYQDRFLRHADSVGWTEGIRGASDAGLKQDATFKVVPGLADSRCYSFESSNFPGHYLRHKMFRIRSDRADGSAIFRGDATFCGRAALDGSAHLSLESKNLPGYYIRHRSAQVWLDAFEDSPGYRQDATWQAAPAWWKSEVYLTTNSLRSIRVARPGFTDRFVRHYQALGFTAPVAHGSDALLKQDATFRIVSGLADSSCYSFESLNFPGSFLHHNALRVRMGTRTGARIFDEDATFCAQSSLSGYGLALQSYNYPNRYLRHAFGELWISTAGERVPGESAYSFAEDASWDIVSPWWW